MCSISIFKILKDMRDIGRKYELCEAQEMKDESHEISALVLNMDFSFDNASINTKYLHCNLHTEVCLRILI